MSRSTFIIEPDNEGAWQITLKTYGVISDPWYPAQKYQQRFEYHIYKVERISLSTDTTQKPAELAADAALLADSYRLVFRDKNGNDVQNF